MARKRKEVIITRSEASKVSKIIYFDLTRPRPVQVITWDDRNGKQWSIYLYSDNYPDLPTARSVSFTNANKCLEWVTKKLSPIIYWYNKFPHLIGLVKSVSAALQLFASVSKSSYSNIQSRALYCGFFFDWLTKNDIRYLESLADIDLEILLRYRSYLYNDHRKDCLAKGLSNQVFWNCSIPGLIKFFLERPSFQLTHTGLFLATFPKFNTRKSGVRSSVTPYSDIEMFEIITAADRVCSRYMHNWKVMREIEQLQVGDWKNIEDVCWFIVNIERHSSNGGRGIQHQYQCLQQHHGLTYPQFYKKYSEAEIQLLASRGSCPTDKFQMSTFESLSGTWKCAYARAWVRRSLSKLFDARKTDMTETLQSDRKPLFISFKELDIFRHSLIGRQRSFFWEAAGFQPLPEVCPREISALFYPSLGNIYAFHLFVLATSGINLHVLNSIDRNTILSDLDPDNVVYLGIKNRTGRYNYRHEEIVVPRDEKDGVHERLQFVKEITSPFIRYLPSAGLWLGTRGIKHSPNSSLAQLKKSEYEAVNKQFCSQFGLQEVCYGANGELIDSTPMTFINSRRLRKSNVYRDMANEVPYHLIQAALADNSFNTVFKYYIDTAVQRQLNFKAIAALQCILLEEIKGYSRSGSFAGEVVYDIPLSAARDISNNFLSACTDTDCSFSEAVTAGNRCKARFDVCLGCQNSRVFKEHLPAICFRIMQYDDKKLFFSIQDWDASYGLHRLRAINCLERYARHGVDYAHHIDAAWIIAKSDGGVYLPPLI